jgi:hypothetical protein
LDRSEGSVALARKAVGRALWVGGLVQRVSLLANNFCVLGEDIDTVFAVISVGVLWEDATLYGMTHIKSCLASVGLTRNLV